ncbi:hypothetical protein AGMMS49957_16350 [Synergistales bacterium]|nr:hypothetical protein AGMMS49957_16350 [Synergistales bacterium]
MPTTPTAERGAATERERGVFTDNLIPERVFNSEMRRIDSALSGIERTLDRMEARFDKVDERFDKVNTRVDRLESLLWGILSAVVISIIAQIVLRYV